MAAHHHLNPDQLKLFVDPEEHIASMTSSVDLGHYHGSMSHMWKMKEAEAKAPLQPGTPDWMQGHGAGVHASLSAGEGVREPIKVLLGPKGPIQEQGHHRIAAAAAVQRETGRKQYVPVEYGETHLQGALGRTEIRRRGRLLK